MAHHDAQFQNSAVDELVRAPQHGEADHLGLPPMHTPSSGRDIGLIAQLQAELSAAEPRLEAFSKLEMLARERRSTPESVAVQVTIDVLEEERKDLRDELLLLRKSKKEEEEAISMLTEQRHVAESDDVARVHAELVEETAELLDELESIRADAVRLMGEKAALEKHVQELRNQAQSLIAESPGRTTASASDGPPDELQSNPTGLGVFDTSDEGDEAVAFDRFFDADVGTDKARAWMLK